ncbi:MAG: hypothetical protein V1681_04340 [Candidatus Neomarinimicrobiota bacterium]
MLKLFLFLLVLYLIWKIIKPNIPHQPTQQPPIKREEPPASLQINKDQIEDAHFKEIDDPDTKTGE